MPEAEPHAVRRLYFYMLPDDLKPSYVVDVTQHRQTIENAIQCYASQMPIARGPHSAMEFLTLFRRSYGLRIGAELGEGFLCEDQVGGDAELLMSF